MMSEDGILSTNVIIVSALILLAFVILALVFTGRIVWNEECDKACVTRCLDENGAVWITEEYDEDYLNNQEFFVSCEQICDDKCEEG
jgi:hypothetical protein